MKEYDRTVAEKLLYQIKDWDRVEVFSPSEILKYTMRDLEEAGDDVDALKGRTLTTRKAIRLVPDILESEGELFFPVFSSEEEMGEYGEHFSHIPMSFVDALEMAKNHEADVRGIVVNAFTESFVVVSEMFEVLAAL